MNDALDDVVAALLVGTPTVPAVMYLIKRFAVLYLEVLADREDARARYLRSRRAREALELPPTVPPAAQRSPIELSRWVLNLLDPEDAERYGLESASHLHERYRDGEIAEARLDRRRLERHALRVAASQRLRQPRRSRSLADAGTVVKLHNDFVRYLLTAGQRWHAACFAQHAVVVAEKYLADEHPARMTSRIQLPEALQWSGHTNVALALAVRVHDDCRALLGPDHRLTVMAQVRLALSQQWAGHNTTAMQITEQVIAQCTTQLGPEHPETLQVRLRLAWSYDVAGDYATAIAMKQELLALYISTLGPDHPDTLTSRGSLANSLRLIGRYDDAIAELQTTLTARERRLRHKHPDTLWTLAILGKCFEHVGRISQAVAAQQTVVPICADVLGPEHHDTLMYRTYLSSAYQTGAKLLNPIGPGLDEAIRIIDDVVRLREQLHRDHPDTLEARAQQAHAYRDAGRNAEAVALMQQIISDATRVRGADHLFTTGARATIAAWRHTDR